MTPVSRPPRTGDDSLPGSRRSSRPSSSSSRGHSVASQPPLPQQNPQRPAVDVDVLVSQQRPPRPPSASTSRANSQSRLFVGGGQSSVPASRPQSRSASLALSPSPSAAVLPSPHPPLQTHSNVHDMEDGSVGSLNNTARPPLQPPGQQNQDQHPDQDSLPAAASEQQAADRKTLSRSRSRSSRHTDMTASTGSLSMAGVVSMHKLASRSRRNRNGYSVRSPTTDDVVTIAIEDLVDTDGRPVNTKSKRAGSPKRRGKGKEGESGDGDGGRDSDNKNMDRVADIGGSSGSLDTMGGDKEGSSRKEWTTAVALFEDLTDVVVPRSADSPQVVYVQEHGRYRKMQGSHAFDRVGDSAKRTKRPHHAHTPISMGWRDSLIQNTNMTLRVQHTVFTLVHSIYAGICLLSILILPTPSSSYTSSPLNTTTVLDISLYTPLNSTAYNVSIADTIDTALLSDPRFRFLVFYSDMASWVTTVFNIGSVLACFAALERVGPAFLGRSALGGLDCRLGVEPDTNNTNRRARGRIGKPLPVAVASPSGPSNVADRDPWSLMMMTWVMGIGRFLGRAMSTWQVVLRLLILASALASFVPNTLLVPIERRIIESQTDTLYGGVYGKTNWFYDPALVSTSQVSSDLDQWRSYNFARGLFGVVCWCLCALSIDRGRVLSLLDVGKRADEDADERDVEDGVGDAWADDTDGSDMLGSGNLWRSAPAKTRVVPV
ncbi:hypothetical protein BC831DRAFT_449558 [Entophlyctis helioformis]|nr:hypothetical protein BC831DRAFT_449558 [Entophlyctis helioformis]